MAKLTDRTELVTPADGDFYVTTDVSDTTDAATGTDKKITWANLKAGFKAYFDTLYGNVSKVGTPVNNQVGVWTGDGTIEGDTALAFDTTSDTLTITGASPTLNLIATDNSELEVFTQSDATYMKLEDRGATNVGPYFELYKNSATPAANDDVGTIYFVGEDSAGNKQNYAHVQGVIVDTTSTSEDGKLAFAVTTAGTLASELELTGAELYPTTNDGLGLGNATNQFSDLFLAEGGVINWDNGDATLTQVGDVVTLAGADLKVTTPGNVSTSVVTTDATQTLTNKTLTSAVLGTGVSGTALADTTGVNTGTSTSTIVTPDALAGSYAGTKSLSVQVYDGTTDVATGDGKAYITIPEALNGMNLVRAQATVVTAGTTNATTVMIHNKTDTQDMLSGAISIASGGTVGTVGTVNGSFDDVATNDVLRIDVDSVSTTAPKGLMVVLEFRLP